MVGGPLEDPKGRVKITYCNNTSELQNFIYDFMITTAKAELCIYKCLEEQCRINDYPRSQYYLSKNIYLNIIECY